MATSDLINRLKSPRFFSISTVILLIICYFPVFHHLDYLPLQLWDESRLAVNALEMSENGELFTTHFDGEPDTWNTKPPFLIWLQAFCIKIFGPNELAIRLPIALATLGTVLFLLWFCTKILNKYWLGYIASLILITSPGYIGLHASRTADYDNFLTFFTTATLLLFFSYLLNGKKIYWYLSLLFLVLGVWTKSIAGLLFTPAMAIWFLLYKNYQKPTAKELVYAICIVLIGIIGLYGIIELYRPGYFSLITENELGGRYLEIKEGHKHSGNFYLINSIESRFVPYYVLLIAGILLAINTKELIIKKLGVFLFITIFSYFLIVSMGQTKLFWYDVPLFPLMAICSAVPIYVFIEVIQNTKWMDSQYNTNSFVYSFLLILFTYPYYLTVDKISFPKDTHNDMAYYLKKRPLDKNKRYQILFDNYEAHNLFYSKALNLQGYNIDMSRYQDVVPGDLLLIQDEFIKHYIDSLFYYQVVDEYKGVNLINVLQKKSVPQNDRNLDE